MDIGSANPKIALLYAQCVLTSAKREFQSDVILLINVMARLGFVLAWQLDTRSKSSTRAHHRGNPRADPVGFCGQCAEFPWQHHKVQSAREYQTAAPCSARWL